MTGKPDPAQDLRNLSEIALDKWNSGLDALFYDVPALAQREVEWLWNEHLAEGAILLVDPRNDGHVGIRCTDEAGVFAECRGRGENVGVAVAIPGVGSSALGAAALGRNVADYLGRTVTVIVAGYGKSDLVADALGGWLVLEAHNQLRVLAEHLAQHPGSPATAAGVIDSAAGATAVYIRDQGKETPGQGLLPAATAHLQQASTADRAVRAPDAAAKSAGSLHHPDQTALRPIPAAERGTSETKILYRLLVNDQTPVRLLVGHSKGCYSIATALDMLVKEKPDDAQDLGKSLKIVTLGAVVRLPSAFSRVTQLLGKLDSFGLANSTGALTDWMLRVLRGNITEAPFVAVPFATHSLNTRFSPFSLHVDQALDLAGVLRGPLSRHDI
ncbi:MAG: hypothetical protein AW08_01533 [Candidatus Accumulibacter adjunctus]|uniref:Uncharacterized protein n=1 Tax=Candidatus Accumulibacter adjunctus TaxID=1454001 RepID=A0A011PNQ2_9PROT|nr:MAG: hypothetical protein AW08_01533 [Candidatus Accumulibacter adjunctus]